MKHLDLFSGIGGFALAARRVGWETVAFCESEPFCQDVLRKHWPDVPIHPDVRTLTTDAVGPVDIITGGYPCQPFSLAGERRGAGDDRHLWPSFARLIRELRPRWVLGENVAGHITLGLDDVLTDLEGMGYAWEAFVIPAVAVDARHRRDRVWIAANASGSELRKQPVSESRRSRSSEPRDDGATQPLADATSIRRERHTAQRSGACESENQGGLLQSTRSSEVVANTDCSDAGVSRNERREEGERGAHGNNASGRSWQWSTEPAVGRVAHGVSGRVDRLRSLGNAIVPQVATEIFRAIDAVNKERM